ncbi:hypothetical protein M2T75_36860, partial [Klebsiella pneumoniae]|nr:hypothetical protein [Klebsiella pneumoniae]
RTVKATWVKPTSTFCMDDSPEVNDVSTLQPQVNLRSIRDVSLRAHQFLQGIIHRQAPLPSAGKPTVALASA